MNTINNLWNKEWKLKLLLFICSFVIYFIYFHNILLHLNTVLSGLTSDTIKNYYTYVYHIKNDGSALVFNGMSYPYGEHAVYTDCQPILTFVLRFLPFTHGYLIGIMHALIFLSLMLSPLIIYSILKRLDIDRCTSFFVSLAIAVLAPQFLKINAGHHGLAYTFMIPLSFLLILKYMQQPTAKNYWTVFAYHCLLFLWHPYMGLSVSVFAFMAVFGMQVLTKDKSHFIKTFFANVWMCLTPVILFKLFMWLTDKHPNRTTEPYGVNLMVENMDSILAPVFGPFKNIMEVFFNKRPDHYEGHSYLGAFTILLSVILLVLMPFQFKKLKVKKEVLVFFVASLVLLFISFGWHNSFLALFGLKLEFMNQFRATCRFAWFFYYGLALLVTVSLYHYLKTIQHAGFSKYSLMALPILFFGFNMLEADAMFKMDKYVFWNFRNVFNEEQLNNGERKILADLKNSKVQAIVPLPLFESGSEMYDRLGFNNSMLPSMIYSYHSGLPIFSVMMSRTSISETENEINLMNSYKKDRPAADRLNDGSFFVIKTKDQLLPDEYRLLREVKVFCKNDSLEMGYVSKQNFLKRKLDAEVAYIANNVSNNDSGNVVFLPFENRKPFINTVMNGMEKITALDSNKVQSGQYVVSFRYYYTLKKFQAMACNLIITEGDAKDFKWKYDLPLRFMSGFYSGYAVFEYLIDIDRKKKYEFVIAGRSDMEYKISDFMLRPFNKSVGVIYNRDTVYNNFPE